MASSSSRMRRTGASACGRRATTSAARGRAGAVESGVAVGLFAPPLLASVAVGAVAGGVVGRFVDHRVEKEIHDKIGENLPPGSAGIIAVFDDEQRLGCRAGARGRAAAVGCPGRQARHTGVEGVARRGDGEVQSGPDGAADPGSELRRHGRAHARRVRRRLDDQHDAVAAGRGAERVARADRRRGLRQPVDVRRPRLDAGDDAGRRAGPEVQRLPRDGPLLADPGRPADRPKPPHRRLRVDRGVPRPVSGLLGERAEGLRSVRPGASGQRLLDRRVRQVAPDSRSRPGGGRAVRPLAERVGLRSLLGDPRRRGGPVRPRDHAGQHDPRRPEGHRHQAVLLAGRSDRSGGALAPPGARPGPGKAVVHLLLDRVRARAAPRRGSSGARSTAASSTRGGMCSARRRSNGRRRWA